MVLLPKHTYNDFSENRDTIRHWKTFRVIFNEMPVLLLILSWCYFSCLKVYSDKIFNAYFYEEMFFKIFVANRDRKGIIHVFNLSVGSHVSIILNFATEEGGEAVRHGEGCKTPDNSVSLTWLQRLIYNCCLPYSYL